MKICKNDSTIILYPVIRCSDCAIRTKSSPCLWLRVVGTYRSRSCGGIRIDVLSDIFKI